ncbi:TonB-dependent receptor P3 [subsurface metagenome]
MKITIFLLLFSVVQVMGGNSYSQDTRLSLNLKNVPIEKVLDEIENQSEFFFLFNQKLVNVDRKVDIDVKDKRIKDILYDLFTGEDVNCLVMDRQILLSPKYITERVKVTRDRQPQEIVVTGKVTDEDGNPLPGVNIIIKGTLTGAITDVDGNYRIEVKDPDAVLVFSFVAMLTKEIKVGVQTEINITLVRDIIGLEEVVAIGYGTVKRANMAGAVASVDSRIFEARPVTNTMNAIQGEIAGLVVERGSGQPGAEGFSIQLRGYSSTNGGNTPLILIDGIPGDLNTINPSDIKSLSILKDASASIYGARAANGVILVTTKTGKKGRPTIQFSSNTGITKPAGMLELPTYYEFALMDNEANINSGAAPLFTPERLEKILRQDPVPETHPTYGSWMLFFTETDWYDAVIENGSQQNYNLSISGGGENSNYMFSAGYHVHDGILKYGPDDNNRYNLRLNYDYEISKKLRLETKLSYENQRQKEVGGIGNANIIREAIFGMPNHPVYTQSGEKFFAQGGWGNALAFAKEGKPHTRNWNRILTNLKLDYDIFEGLKLIGQAGVNYSYFDNTDIAAAIPLYKWDESGIMYYNIANSPDKSNATYSYNKSAYKNFTGYLQYKKLLADKHNIGIMAGLSHEENDYNYFSAKRDNFISQELFTLNLGGTDNMSNSGGGTHWVIRSFFSRLSYIFNQKYIFEANLRYDGSSRFHPDVRWGLFPSISLGWRLSEENFVKNLDFFDNLKLRLSWGQTGNQEGVGLYDYVQLISIGGLYPFGQGEKEQTAWLSGMVSKDRTWETLVTRNAGVDVSVFSSKLDFSFDYFIKTNKNMLIPITYPSVLGATAPYTNSGELKTWGWETSLSWRDNLGDLSYSARFILSDAQNEITNYGGRDVYGEGLNWIREGYPVNTYFAYEFDGIIRTDAELEQYKQLDGVPSDISLGDAMFKDIDGNGKISPYGDTEGESGDLINAGTISPRYNYGLNLNVQYKGFDLGIFIQGVAKRTMFREGDYAMPWDWWWRQPPRMYFNKTWAPDRPDAEYPRLSHGTIRRWNYAKSTLNKVNSAYLRFKNLQIGYTLPSTISEKVFISKARIYFSGHDLWELHNVEGGWDPEANRLGNEYPFYRVYSFGLDITF